MRMTMKPSCSGENEYAPEQSSWLIGFFRSRKNRSDAAADIRMGSGSGSGRAISLCMDTHD
jgi:hypothetical protein